MYPRELIKLLTKNGWQTVSQNGSHVKLKKRKSNRNNSTTQ